MVVSIVVSSSVGDSEGGAPGVTSALRDGRIRRTGCIEPFLSSDLGPLS